MCNFYESLSREGDMIHIEITVSNRNHIIIPGIVWNECVDDFDLEMHDTTRNA